MVIEERYRDFDVGNRKSEFRVVVRKSLMKPASKPEGTTGKLIGETIELMYGSQRGCESVRSVAFEDFKSKAECNSVGGGIEFACDVVEVEIGRTAGIVVLLSVAKTVSVGFDVACKQSGRPQSKGIARSESGLIEVEEIGERS